MSLAGPAPTAPSTTLHVLGALALELRGDAPVSRQTLAQAEVGALAELVAHDLAGFAPEAAALELVTVGAHYDPVELLRPGWPLHQELDQLAARAPRSATQPGGRIIAFGAHDAQLPGALTPSPDFAGGPLRLVPFVLGGDADVATRVGDAFERELLERGMAGAATALAAQEAFGLQVEHARYLTVHDLAAMMAMQYDHAGLGPLWPLLETALLQPEGEHWLDAPPEPLVHYANGEARIALFEPRAWKARYATEAPCETPECRAKLERLHQHFQSRQRQIAAVLGAHGVTVNFVHCAGEQAREALD
ncbi:hypothetical protein HIV01_014540 [Lysobacter arenosi]|uniref:Uncharacterized protein n=1 Tax=Lysobacter arenosi TaxID=2795387 RepID=A0ABX7R8G0_9GAMM|nr:hypothetical protein [Lysobacter arenosi]QSX74393.1 hypothetical protein HIV01_014540 [Lysobacter arenosi]